MLSLCSRIGAPIKTEKVEGPTTCLAFLGIVLDTVTMEASISSEHRASLLTAIRSGPPVQPCSYLQMLPKARVRVHIGQTIGWLQAEWSPEQVTQHLV